MSRLISVVGWVGLLTFLLFFASVATKLSDANSLEGSQKVGFLLDRLESSPDFKVRLAAAEALGKIADGTLADWMLRAFRKEDNDAVRLATLYAIGRIPEAIIIPPLLELSTQELLREPEIIALERLVWNHRKAINITEWTKALLDSKKSGERALAAYLIGMVADVSEIPALVAALSDPVPAVRLRAVQAIGRIGSPEGKPFCQAVRRTDRNPLVVTAAGTCSGEIELISVHRVPPENARRVDLKLDLDGLKSDAVTPSLMRAYLNKNVNPRELERAVARMQRGEIEEREDKTIPLVFDETLRRTIRVNAQIITLHSFPNFDLNRLREVVRDRAGHINQCYLEALKRDRKLGGKVGTQFLILANGAVSTVEIQQTTLKDAAVLACVADRLRGIRFPTIPFKYVTMKYDFTFTAPKDERYDFDPAP